MKLDGIHLQEIIANGKHGCLDFEKVQLQPFEVDITLFADFSEPCHSDALDDSFDYARIEEIVVKTIENCHFNLIERLADEILQRLFAIFHRLEAIQIELYKPQAPLERGSIPSIQLYRQRTDYEPQQVYLSLGSNLTSAVGDPSTTLQEAINRISALTMTKIRRQSSDYETAPVGAEGDSFINKAVLIETRLNPDALLSALQKIENDLGRERKNFHSARTLDIDIIFYGEIRRKSPELRLPHPHWKERAFVIAPLLEIECPFCHDADLTAIEGQEIKRCSK